MKRFKKFLQNLFTKDIEIKIVKATKQKVLKVRVKRVEGLDAVAEA